MRPRLVTCFACRSVWALIVGERKNQKTNISGVIFHPYGEKNPGRIWIKFCNGDVIRDVITNANFEDDRLRHFCMARGQILGSFHLLSSLSLQHSCTTVRLSVWLYHEMWSRGTITWCACCCRPKTFHVLSSCSVHQSYLSCTAVGSYLYEISFNIAVLCWVFIWH